MAPTKSLTVELYTPHEGQKLLHNCASRFRVMSCGRRFGKTMACTNEVAKFALEHSDTLSMWVAPVYRQTQIAFRLMSKALKQVLAADPNKTELRLELINGSTVEFRSTERFDHLRGEGIHFLVIDEAARVAQEAWEAALRPALSDTNGRAIFISTPLGRNWFYRMFLRGQDSSQDQYRSFTFPTSANPYVRKDDIEEARLALPQDVFRQEYLAEFLEESAGVFRNVDDCVQGELEEPKFGHSYILGWDPAKYADFSVMTVVDVEEQKVVAFDRSNGVEYRAQLDRLVDLAYRYNGAFVVMDCTGVGDPLLEQVRERNLQVEGFLFTSTSKSQLVENLIVKLEKAQITFPDIPILINELKSFEHRYTPSRYLQYSAPEGMTDDCVMSLALAAWRLVTSVQTIPLAVSYSVPVPVVVRSIPSVVETDDEEVNRRQLQASRFLREVFTNVQRQLM